jgi:hypothetical protein
VAITAPRPTAVTNPKINIAREIVSRSVMAMFSGPGKNPGERNSCYLA